MARWPEKSLYLFKEAFKTARRPMVLALELLCIITIIFATIFYFADSYKKNNKSYNYWKSLLWAITQYIGDPGKFGGEGPKTVFGRLVASLLGVVSILIIAVPAGLIASGFSEASSRDNREKYLKNIESRIEKAFRREQDAATLYRHVPRYIELGTLQARKNLSEQDIIDAVRFSNNFRLRNLATAEKKGEHASDHLVVEMFPLNTDYGFFINRGSNITIACPSASSEAAIGNFGYYLALMGGFNFISKELEPDEDEFTSYYLIDDPEIPLQRKKYMSDLKQLTKSNNNWTIFLISSERQSDYTMHFITSAVPETGRKSTIIDEDKFSQLYNSLSDTLKNKYELLSELNQEYRALKNTNSSVIIGGGKTTNTLTIRVASDFVVWDPRYFNVCKTIAEVINEIVGDPSRMAEEGKMTEKGTGYIY